MVEMDGGVGVVGGGQQTPAPRRWRLVDERCDLRTMETDYVRRFHRHEPLDHQCSSAVAKHIKAPVHLEEKLNETLIEIAVVEGDMLHLDSTPLDVGSAQHLPGD